MPPGPEAAPGSERPLHVGAIVLAAGAATRFGSPKALATIGGRPMLERVLDVARAARLDPVIVVLGTAAEAVERSVAWEGEQRLINPDPARGLASSLRLGVEAMAEAAPRVDGALVLLADQPRTSPEVVAALVEAARQSDRPFIAPRYADGGGSNPVLIRRAGFDIVAEAAGDRGLGPLLDERAELVTQVPVAGANIDVDTPADLVAVLEAEWADRVRRNREQVDRVREAPDGADFYRTVTSLFVADPRRQDDPVLDALVELVRPDDVVLDIGAGAGRYALPLALHVREVVAVDPSASMLDGLREGMRAHGIANVRPVEARWPRGEGEARTHPAGQPVADAPLVADLSLIAHVGYDIEAIGPFLEAMEAATRRLCVGVLMRRSPASVAEPFWPPVHGEARVPLPALPDFVELLTARGRQPAVRIVEAESRRWRDRDELLPFLRRQTWTNPGSEKDRRLVAALEAAIEVAPDGSVTLRDAEPLEIGVVTWAPAAGGA